MCLRPRLRFPLPSAYLLGGCFFLTDCREHPLSQRRWRLFAPGSPRHRIFFLRGTHGISQVAGPSSSNAPWSNSPADAATSCPLPLIAAAVFRFSDTVDIRDILSFRGRLPMAHLLACLRIANAVTHISARLTTNLPGSALVGRVSHPLDDLLIFRRYRHLLPIRPALPGRTRGSFPSCKTR